MSDEPVRQHHRLATGQGLTPAPSKEPSPGFKKGGAVKAARPNPFKKGGPKAR